MSGKKSDAPADRASTGSGTIWAALLLGGPMAAGVLHWLLNAPELEGTLVRRYVEHPIEQVEIVAFCCAVAALLAKAWGWLFQRAALRRGVLPAWDGAPQPASEARALLAHLGRLPRRLRRSWVGRRGRSVLDYLARRGSAAGLDDHVRVSADNDAMALDASYSFVRFQCWAIPILGFLGTVLGITEAIAGVKPEDLENNISSVTGGLATAFDTTGLALMLTMAAMFLSFLVERLEQGAMQDVDGYVEDQLFHRFRRPENENAPLLQAVQQLVERQAEIWAASLAATESRLRDEESRQQERLTQGLRAAMEQSLASHQEVIRRMRDAAEQQTAAALEPVENLAAAVRVQAAALEPIAEGMEAMGAALERLRKGEGQLIKQQELLAQNLAALTASGAFEHAVHSLTAAVHLLTARAGGVARAEERKAA